ncbi:hypothetical protein J2T09_000963 [Neorhizobium huautlense]|uniref:Uncharacterized protein n=1 Tax=Neorhizobium huautlense TaxID=67774 RepID=A0ABT9PP22_9HYPH|nr:hypothetical protein [Neorhizobium huautlense]MDP9836221.1 hypothetical protein [Neorhizobium huautlense]
MIRRSFLTLLLATLTPVAGPRHARGEDMNADWLIAPHHGIGRLTFGLSADEVAAFAPVYGEQGSLITYAEKPAAIEEMIALNRSSLSDETIEILRQSARDLENRASQNLTKGRVPVLLEYQDNRLDGVAVEAGHTEAHFAGQRVFSLDAREVLALFECANGAPGRYNSTEAAFDNIAVSLFSFSITSPSGKVYPMPRTNPNFQERSVTVRLAPYRPAHELDQFVEFSFK